VAIDAAKLARLERGVTGLEARLDRICAVRGVRADAWDESKHPRAPDGKFGSGSASTSTPGDAHGEDQTRRGKADISRELAIASKERRAINLMLVSDMKRALSDMGHSKESIEEASHLLRMHSLGSADRDQMAAIDKNIEDAIENDTPAGKALRDGAWLEAEAYRAWQSGAPARNAKERANLKRDWDAGFLGGWDRQEGMSFDDWIKKEHSYLNDDKPQETIYRGGNLRDGVSSWTQKSTGAHVGSGVVIKPDYKMTIDDALDAGGLVLGGLARMMGASGEAEVTMYFPKGGQEAANVQPMKKWSF